MFKPLHLMHTASKKKTRKKPTIQAQMMEIKRKKKIHVHIQKINIKGNRRKKKKTETHAYYSVSLLPLEVHAVNNSCSALVHFSPSMPVFVSKYTPNSRPLGSTATISIPQSFSTLRNI